jgi:alpha-L-fucosidase 2
MTRMLASLGALAVVALCAAGCATATQITSNDTNMCLNVVNHGAPQPGEPVIVRDCDPYRNQQWYFNGSGPITGLGNFCVDVAGGAKATDGARVIYTPCAGAPSQNWSAGPNGSLVGVNGKCMDIDGGYATERAPVIIKACNGSPSQRWVSH